MNAGVPLWIEIPVALLLVASGVFTLSAGIGLVRFKTFFMRMHPPALVFSFSAWCVTLATVLYFSAQEQGLALHAWLIVIFLSLTVPVTTTLLARTELFRRRSLARFSDPSGQHPADDIPAPLSPLLVPTPGPATDRPPAKGRRDRSI